MKPVTRCRQRLIRFGGIATSFVTLTSCSSESLQGSPPIQSAAISASLNAPERLQITLTYDRRRPYEIRRLARRCSESEILHYLDLHFSQAGTSKRDTVLLIPSGKGLGPGERTDPSDLRMGASSRHPGRSDASAGERD